MKLTVSKLLRRICIIFLLCLSAVLLTTSCEQNVAATNSGDNTTNSEDFNVNIALENGFILSKGDPSPPPLYCAYKSDTKEFAIDDVTLDFYYGGYYSQGLEYELENRYNFPSFELYFTDDKSSKYFVKSVQDNFVSEKYTCDIIHNQNMNVSEIKFKHSETITIPKEIFTKESGQIFFSIYSTNAREDEPKVICITSISIFYKVTNDKVILSSRDF